MFQLADMPDIKLIAFVDAVRSCRDPVPIYIAQRQTLLEFCDRNNLPGLSTVILNAAFRRKRS